MDLISETDKIIDQQTIFFKTAMDVDLMMTVNEVRMGLRETTHGLIAIGGQIIDYLNRIDYQSRIVRKIRQLKYMRDQQMLTDSTDILKRLGNVNDVWMEPQNRYRTFVSLDFLRNEDSAIDILQHVRRRLSKKTIIHSRSRAGLTTTICIPQPMNATFSTIRSSSTAFWHRALTSSRSCGTIRSRLRPRRRNGSSSSCSWHRSTTATNALSIRKIQSWSVAIPSNILSSIQNNFRLTTLTSTTK